MLTFVVILIGLPFAFWSNDLGSHVRPDFLLLYLVGKLPPAFPVIYAAGDFCFASSGCFPSGSPKGSLSGKARLVTNAPNL
jgi:hypothetical protein